MKKYIQNKVIAEILEWAITILGMLLLVLILRNFIFRTALVSGPSMLPTLHHDDRVIIFKLPYIFGEPKFNDIVAFPYKENPSQYFIKRIVGLPGDVINIENRKITINGSELEDAFSMEPLASLGDTVFPITVPEGKYFVLGDHRNHSNDSRFTAVGCIAKSELLGRVKFRYWPMWPENRFGRIG